MRILMTAGLCLLASVTMAQEADREQQLRRAEAELAEARRKFAVVDFSPRAELLAQRLAMVQEASSCGDSAAHRGASVLVTQITDQLAPMMIHKEIRDIVEARRLRHHRGGRGLSRASQCEVAMAMAGQIALERLAPARP